MDVLLDEEPAIFTKSKKDFTPLDKVTHVVIANKFMVLAMANNVLFRMNLHSPSERNGLYFFFQCFLKFPLAQNIDSIFCCRNLTG